LQVKRKLKNKIHTNHKNVSLFSLLVV